MFRSEPRQHRSSETIGDRIHSDQAQPAGQLCSNRPWGS